MRACTALTTSAPPLATSPMAQTLRLAVRPVAGGFILWGGGPKEKPWEEAAFSATVSEPGAKVNYGWFRGGWWDALTMAWKDVAEGACYDRAPLTEGDPSPGASLFVPLQLAAGGSMTVALRLAW